MARSKNNTNLILGIGVLVLIGVMLVGTGVVKIGGTSFTIGGDGTQVSNIPTSTPTQFEGCNTATSTSLTFAVYDTYGNLLTPDYNIWYTVNGNEQATGPIGTALTLAPYDVVGYRVIDEDATHDVYGFTGTYTVPCKSSDKVTLNLGMQDTALSTTVYNIAAGADTVDTADAPATVGAGGTAKGKIYVAATTNDGVWSTSENGRKIGVALDYNSLLMKQPVITSVDNGTFSRLDSVPNGHSVTAVVSTATSTVFYEINSDALNDLGDLTIKFEAEALTGTSNPSTLDGNIGITIYDTEMYQLNDRSWAVGFRNSDSTADLAETNATDTFHVS